MEKKEIYFSSVERNFRCQEILHVMSEWNAMNFYDSLLRQECLGFVLWMWGVRYGLVDRDVIVKSQL